MAYHDFLFNELVQDKQYRQKLTLCIDIVNVLLAKVDLNDEKDLKHFERCKNISHNFIIIPKKNVKQCKRPPGHCKDLKGYC